MGVLDAISQFLSGIIGIVVSLANSVFAVFHAVFALGADIVQSAFAVLQHLLAMVADVFTGVLGFVTANFVAIGLLAGGYYAYTVYEKRNRRLVKRS
ncbi:hypothetical protein HYPSUDRAFT_199213 [Hypholoma sublateritium FD-334 SS-4]|uniref:Uncharacterized protein n=1 Tax=Hypholoma sublateritium (strain FD-334 SS-4) TaxID=945553 RepID=A0A0D2LEL9_HYPSF|nr:hypothetical protein HYPSUDRAFT_199213 [Hypholoma sublateritium FD-334 SS-4]